MPANPGVNPSLTIAALAEYAMAQIPRKNGSPGGDAPMTDGRQNDALFGFVAAP